MRLNHTRGWRLLYGPTATLEAANVAFIGLNPGGSEVATGHGEFEQPEGSAYVIESWAGHPAGESPLQRQVRALFSYLRQEPHNVLAGNLVPFRSPSWAELPDRRRTIDFGAALWKRILERAKPKLVICMGKETYHSLSRVLGAGSPKVTEVNWGKVTARRASYYGGEIVGLPEPRGQTAR